MTHAPFPAPALRSKFLSDQKISLVLLGALLVAATIALGG